MHLSCVKIRTISKWTETSFHLSVVTSEYPQVCAKQLLSLWYIRRKPCTYLALTLPPSPNVLKWDFTWPTSPRSSIGCIKKRFSSPWYVQRKQCTYLASTLALSPSRPKWAFTWASSSMSTIRCVQNDSWAYCTFGANRAPILHQD
jgi:hypothetical protein